MRYSNLFAEEVEAVYEFALSFHRVYGNISLITDKELHAGIAIEALLQPARNGYNAKLTIARAVYSFAAAVWRSGTADRPYASRAGAQLAANVLLAAAQMPDVKGGIIIYVGPALT